MDSIVENQILEQLNELKSKFDEFEASQVAAEWIPKKALMKFLGYGATQMTALLNTGYLVVAQIGNRKFIHKASIEKFLQQRIVQQAPSS